MNAYLTSSLANYLFIAIAAGLVYGVFVIGMRGPEDPLLAAIIRPTCLLYAKVLHRLRVVSRLKDPVPAQGAAIVVANHRSGVDPLLLGLVTRRHVRFLMAREYFETRGLQCGFRALGCIPVNRDGNDLGATKAALKALRGGEVIGIFPQGGIREAGGSLEGKAGVALLALRTGAPVVPFYIDGSPNLDSVFRSLITPSRTTIACGAPLQLGAVSEQKPSREELARVTTTILDAITSLGPKHVEGPETSQPPPAKAL